MFSVPLQVHPCRASLDGILRWRPARSQSERNRSSSPGNRPLLANGAPVPRSDHSPLVMSELRFTIITCVILILSYIAALSTQSLDRVLAYVGSTGSTSISFILPGLFYYKISHPDNLHHQRLIKGDDDAAYSASDSEDGGADPLLSADGAPTAGGLIVARPPRKWRWDLEHLDHVILRKLALVLAIYGVVVMAVCLVMNAVFSVSE